MVRSREITDISISRCKDHGQIGMFGDERNQVQGRIVRVVENKQPSLVQWSTREKFEGIFPRISLVAVSSRLYPRLEVGLDTSKRARVNKRDFSVPKYVRFGVEIK